MSSNVLSIQTKPASKTRPAATRTGYRDAKKTQAEAVAYFEAKLAKWTERTAAFEGAKLTVIIPGYAFYAEFPNGFSIYYELEP